MTKPLSSSVVFNALETQVETLQEAVDALVIPAPVVNNFSATIAGGNMASLAGYANFAAALSAIGATPTTLLIDTDVSITGSTTVPANVKIFPTNGAKFTISSGQTLTINGAMKDPGNVQIFAGAGEVLFAKGTVPYYNTAWRTGPTDNVDATKAITEGLANAAAWLGGVVQLPPGVWLTTGNHFVDDGTRIAGAQQQLNSGYGTVVKMTSGSGDPIFYTNATSGLDSWNITFEHFKIDGNNSTSTGIYIGTTSTGAMGDLQIRDMQIVQCNIGIDYDNGATNLQVVDFVMRNCQFAANIVADFRCDAVNNNLYFERCAFITNTTGNIPARLTSNGNVLFNSCEFMGMDTGYRRQVEKNTVVAASGITSSGNARVVVTWPGILGSPITVTVPVTTTAHTTAALIAEALVQGLRAHATIVSTFYVNYNGADIYIAALDPAANVSGANFTIEDVTSAGITDSLTSTTDTAGVAQTGQSTAVLIQGNDRPTITFLNCQDEAYVTSIKKDSGVGGLSNAVVLMGSNLQGILDFRSSPGSVRVSSFGSAYIGKAIRGVNVALTSVGDGPNHNFFVGTKTEELIYLPGVTVIQATHLPYSTDTRAFQAVGVPTYLGGTIRPLRIGPHPSVASYAGIWFVEREEQVTSQNYALLGANGDLTTRVNAPAGGEVALNVNDVSSAKVDSGGSAGQTRFFLYDVDNGQLERVSVGAADSGGTGFKVLRIPN
jgi:hypothetical protein